MLFILTFFCLAVASPVFAQTSGAENYPNRGVRIVVPFPPGGPTDTYARILADKLQTALGQSFVLENKPRATGLIGTLFVANAPADGYTLLLGANSSHVISSLLQPQRPLDPLKVFRPLSMLLSYPLYLLLNKDVPAEIVAELVALGKSKPGKLNMGSVGTGGAGHLTIEMFNKVTDIRAVHVPYNGVHPAQVGLMAGEIDFLFESIAGSQTLVDAGKLRGVALTGRERSPLLPNVPTLKGVASAERRLQPGRTSQSPYGARFFAARREITSGCAAIGFRSRCRKRFRGPLCSRGNLCSPRFLGVNAESAR